MSVHNGGSELGVMVAKAAPAMGVVVVDTFLGFTLESWVYLLTICYLVLIITHHIYTKLYAPLRDRRRAQKALRKAAEDVIRGDHRGD